MSEISKSALGEKFDKAFEDRLNACTNPEEIKTLMHSREIEQGLVREDWDKSILIPVKQPEPSGFAATVTIAGTKYTLEADSETSLRQKEIDLYRQVFAQPAEETDQQRRDPATGPFRGTAEQQRIADAAANDDTRQIEGDIIERALRERGIDPEALQEVSSQQYNKKWQSATQEFLQSSDWPGGDENRQKLGEVLIAMNATDKPSVQTLRTAFEHMKKNNLLVENAEVSQQNRLAAAKSPEEIREILNYRGDTAMWNR
jgi:hypothetical protein